MADDCGAFRRSCVQAVLEYDKWVAEYRPFSVRSFLPKYRLGMEKENGEE